MATRDPEDFTDAQAQVHEILTAVKAARDRVARSVDQMNMAMASLQSLDDPAPSGYLGTIQFVNSQAAAFPAGEAWQNLKSQTDQITANFANTKTDLQAKLDALAALG